MKLEAKGENEFVHFSRSPQGMAAGETGLVLVAFRDAVYWLTTVVGTGDLKDNVSSYMELYIELNELREHVEDELERIAIGLEAVRLQLFRLGD